MNDAIPILDGTPLPGLRAPDDWDFSDTREVVEISVGGNPVVWTGPVSGQVFTISGGVDTGTLLKPSLDAVHKTRRTGSAVLFDPGNGNTFQVRIPYDPDSIKADRIGNIAVPDANTRYNNIQIKLMKV